MMHVLVVEDEPPILKSICRNVEKAHPLFTVSATASNGREALDLLEKGSTPFDVVITDINMPVMNGLELLSVVAKRFPHIIPVVLSGYEDFYYAKTAFKTGIFDYLLKPIDKQKLREQLDRLASHIEEQRQETVLPLLENGLLYPGRNGELLRALGRKPLALVLFCAGPFPLSEYDYLLPGVTYWNKHKLKNMAQRFLPDVPLWLINGKSPVEQVLVIQSDFPLQDNALEALHQYSCQFDKLPITICCSPLVHDYDKLSSIHHTLRKSLRNQLLFGKSSIVSFQEASEVEPFFERSETLKKEHDLDLDNPNIRTIKENTLGRVERLLDRDCSQVELESFLFHAHFTLMNTAMRSSTYLQVENQLKELISNCYSRGGLLGALSESLDRMLSPRGERRKAKEYRISEIKQFLLRNYNKPINNQLLSARFGLVPSYIGTVFKSLEGVTPSDFLVKVRMEKARELLESRQNLYIKDVALMVGYSDPLYFSRVFKRYFALSPKSIKKKGQPIL